MGYIDIVVQILEMGWFLKGDLDEVGVIVENVVVYNGNLLQRIERKEGILVKFLVLIDVYVFVLFNENLKFGFVFERNYGIYYFDGFFVYNMGF